MDRRRPLFRPERLPDRRPTVRCTRVWEADANGDFLWQASSADPAKLLHRIGHLPDGLSVHARAEISHLHSEFRDTERVHAIVVVVRRGTVLSRVSTRGDGLSENPQSEAGDGCICWNSAGWNRCAGGDLGRVAPRSNGPSRRPDNLYG